MKSLFIVLSLVATSAFAIEIVREGKPVELKTYTKELTVATKCEVVPPSYDRETGAYYGPSCSCVKASVEIHDALKKAYPTMTSHTFPAPGFVMQPNSQCGSNIQVTGKVTYTVAQ